MNPAKHPTPTARLQARVEAMELLLQALVLVLESEPRFTARKLQTWLDICTERMHATGSATPATLAALAQLQREVLQ